MRTLGNIYAASCLIVLGFFVVLRLPWGLLPFSDGVNIVFVGTLLVAFAAYYTFYFYRLEGFELGWFLANRWGFWIVAVAILGMVMITLGLAVYIAPQFYVPALEQGALPFGIAIVSLFWLSLIYLFGYLTVGMVARVVASLRLVSIADAAVNGLIALVCLGLAALFFSLFLEVLNDIMMRIGIANQWTAIWIFVGAVVIAGVIYGILKEPSYHLDDEETSEAGEI
ncbi:MAG: hypothetical protein ABL984_03515 [Pyrinomonadaceae bacterium]